MTKKATLTSGSVPGSIIKMTLPMLIGMVGMSIFNIVDTYFVGQLGDLELAAMSFTFPVIMIQGAISMGLGVGTSAIISGAIGKGDHDQVKRLTTDSLVLSLLLVLVIVIAGILTIDPLFKALGAKGKTLDFVKEYMFIWYLGVPFVTIPMIGNNALRATGDTLTPSIIMVIAILVNISLDPLLIYGLGPFQELRLKGAALATVIARAVSLIASLLILHFKYDMITLRLGRLKEIWESWKRLLYISIPAALTQLIVPLSISIITRLVADYSDQAVAALGIGTRVEMLAFSPLMALGASLIPFIGQNQGAGHTGRIKQGIRFSQFLSLGLGLLIFVVFTIWGRPIALFFMDENVKNTQLVADIAVKYFSIVSLGYGLQGILALNAASFNAVSKPLQAATVNAIRMFALYIPLAILGSKYMGLDGIFWAAMISACLGGIISWIWLSIDLNRPVQSGLPAKNKLQKV